MTGIRNLDVNDKLLERVAKITGEDTNFAGKVIEAAIHGNETINSINSIEKWVDNHLEPHTVLISKDEYTEMCIDALRFVTTQKLTDFGTAKQRDFGQAWADTIRGYLGEKAVVLLLERNFGLGAKLAHQLGTPQDFYDSDIAEIYSKGGWRVPNKKLGIKTTKFNGIWLDIPESQFRLSDVHIQVKIGGSSSHLFSFFKELSVFKDKILKAGRDANYLSDRESRRIWDEIPNFKTIPAYVPGFAFRDKKYKDLDYTGTLKVKHFTVDSYEGKLPDDYREKIKAIESVPSAGEVKFLQIEKFQRKSIYVFNTGRILRDNSDWEKLVQKL